MTIRAIFAAAIRFGSIVKSPSFCPSHFQKHLFILNCKKLPSKNTTIQDLPSSEFKSSLPFSQLSQTTILLSLMRLSQIGVKNSNMFKNSVLALKVFSQKLFILTQNSAKKIFI